MFHCQSNLHAVHLVRVQTSINHTALPNPRLPMENCGEEHSWGAPPPPPFSPWSAPAHLLDQCTHRWHSAPQPTTAHSQSLTASPHLHGIAGAEWAHHSSPGLYHYASISPHHLQANGKWQPQDILSHPGRAAQKGISTVPTAKRSAYILMHCVRSLMGAAAEVLTKTLLRQNEVCLIKYSGNHWKRPPLCILPKYILH